MLLPYLILQADILGALPGSPTILPPGETDMP